MLIIIKSKQERKKEELLKEIQYQQKKVNHLQAEIPYSDYYGINYTEKERKKADSYYDSLKKESDVLDNLKKDLNKWI